MTKKNFDYFTVGSTYRHSPIVDGSVYIVEGSTNCTNNQHLVHPQRHLVTHVSPMHLTCFDQVSVV